MRGASSSLAGRISKRAFWGDLQCGADRRFKPRAMTDDELTDLWETGTVFPGGISHLNHLRIAWVLHARHGSEAALVHLLEGTRRACELHGCPEKFDAALTKRWAHAIASAIERDGRCDSADEFIAAHPDLRKGTFLGTPTSSR